MINQKLILDLQQEMELSLPTWIVESFGEELQLIPLDVLRQMEGFISILW